MNNIIELVLTGVNPLIVIAIGLVVSVLALVVVTKAMHYGDTKEHADFERLTQVRRKYFW